MTAVTRLTPDYIGHQANQAINYAANRFQSAFDRIRGVINSLGAAYRAASYGLRQEVPFERWFFDHGFQKPLDDPSELLKARAWAVLAFVEGAVRTIAELASLVYSQAFEPKEAERHKDVFQAQWQGLKLSLLAILSPNIAKEQAHNEGGIPLIGTSVLNWKWGTLYSGKLDIPLWHVECRHYPWVDRPAN